MEEKFTTQRFPKDHFVMPNPSDKPYSHHPSYGYKVDLHFFQQQISPFVEQAGPILYELSIGVSLALGGTMTKAPVSIILCSIFLSAPKTKSFPNAFGMDRSKMDEVG